MRSMTGYGQGQASDGEWTVTVEVRCVNHRFLDVACRLPRGLSFLEDTARRGLAPLTRGHADVSVTVARAGTSSRQVTLDEPLAAAYAEAGARLTALTGAANDLTVSRLMALDGVTTVTEAAMNEETVAALCAEALADAVRQTEAMRLQEGERLRADLETHLMAAASLRERIAERAPGVVEDYRARLTERLARLPIEPVDPQRLAQEVALIADRCAIDEELARLESHIAQFRCLLAADGETGKKLDFLIQEMNREANTIGSKANDAAIARHVVDLKSEIEKLREQVQNAV